VAALALGQAKDDRSLDILLAWMDEITWDRQVDLAARALSLNRADRARDRLIDWIATGGPSRAAAAVRALAAFRYDTSLADRVRAAARENPDDAIARLASRLLE